MPLYKCSPCNFSTTLKGNYKQHILSKKHRINIGDITTDIIICGVAKKMNQSGSTEMNQFGSLNQSGSTEMNQSGSLNQSGSKTMKKTMEKKSFDCEHCNMTFATNSSRKRHQTTRCKSSTQFETLILEMKEQQETEKARHESEKQDLTDKIDKLLDKVGNTTTNNITNNTQTIILNSYGSEDLSHITDNIKTQMLRIPYAMIPKMIEAVHFNDLKPENKNIVLPNKKENKFKIFKDNKWVYQNKDEALNALVTNKYNILDNHYEKSNIKDPNNMDEFVKMNYLKFRQYYTEGDSELLEKIKEECEMVMLNNR